MTPCQEHHSKLCHVPGQEITYNSLNFRNNSFDVELYLNFLVPVTNTCMHS